ncbi:hypothetical protein IQ227_02580 [Anabaena aphanizomenioides LEGE 00250]|uniref:Uncharacterized protein n=1 Tax=Sphaerospermopsis aphanizomenoides LEGE 00250 TaxID=2777972 RepID=A0ABR9V8Z3_9CYAN|nr:hypothetical protein [Sphaerospermopsis aphanizomenoides]MBE9234954.1 hypothetical protein [Sphaerospermopsis aphanizomenoides LEGE 00250]
MLRIFQNARRLISLCLATLLIVISTITIFPSTASADNNVVKIECTSDCGNIFSFVTGMVSGSAVTIISLTTNTTSLVATGAAIGQTAVAALATLGTAGTTLVSAPVLVPVAATVAIGAAGGYVVSQVVHSFNDNHSQNAN